jgi:hypothetical protein
MRLDPFLLLALSKKKARPVVVAPAAVASVTVVAVEPTIQVDDTMQLSVTLLDASGNVLTGRTVTWASSDTDVAIVELSTGLMTALSAGTVTITATSEGVDGTASVTVEAVDVSRYATFPDSKTELIIGPQLKEGLTPWTYFDREARRLTEYFGGTYPKFWPRTHSQIEGTVEVTNGSTAVTGSGTFFTKRVDPVTTAAAHLSYFAGQVWIEDPAGDLTATDGTKFRRAVAQSVEGDTGLTLTVAWPGTTGSGLRWRTSNPVGNGDQTYTQNVAYYDLGHSIWNEYYRTSDPAHLALARKIADCTFTWSLINEGSIKSPSIVPREMKLTCLILRAIDEDNTAGVPGTSLKWDTCERYVRYMWPSWVGNDIAGAWIDDGLRDPGYVMEWTQILSQVLPDSYPCTSADRGYTVGQTITDGATTRAAMKARVLDAAINYYARLQYPDGSFRWADSTARYLGRRFSLPWHYQFILGCFMRLHEQIKDDPAYVSEAATVRAMFLAATEYTFRAGYIGEDVAEVPGVKWRALAYSTSSDIARNYMLKGTYAVTNGSTTVSGYAGNDFSLQYDLHLADYEIDFLEQLSGTVSAIPGNATVTADVGSGCDFLGELEVGGAVLIRDSTGDFTLNTVGAIAGDGSTFTISRSEWQASNLSTFRGSAAGSGFKIFKPYFDVRRAADGTSLALVTCPLGSTTVTSSNGKFLTGDATQKLEVGDHITIQDDAGRWTFTREVASVVSDTEFTCTFAFTASTNTSYPAATTSRPMAKLWSPYLVQSVNEAGESFTIDRAYAGTTRNDVYVRTLKAGANSIRGDTNEIREARQLAVETIFPLGYAWQLTGEAKWKTWGDELFAACYGKGEGPGTDAYWSVWETLGKAFSEGMRHCSTYLARREM